MRIKGLVTARQATLARADALLNDDGTLGTMFVRFSPFNTWYEINSIWEGRFLERTAPGAFKNTINSAKRADGLFSTKVQFNHGMDFNIGDKLLGVPTRFSEVRADDGYHGPELEVPLEDTSYNRDLVPLLRKGAYGSSFTFEPIRDDWVYEPERSDYNPDGIPERTISEARTFEAGPVTWPASPTASSGMRSLTDLYMEQVAARSATVHDGMVRSWQAFRAMHKTPDPRTFTPTPAEDDSARRQVEQERAERERQLRQIRLRQVRMTQGK